MTTPADDLAPPRVVVGVDIGTTAAKVVAFGLDQAWNRSTVVREYPLIRPVSGQRVQSPDAVLAATFDALSECVSWLGNSDVVAISLSTAMHALIGLDVEQVPITPIITWADARARDEARELRHTDLGRSLHRRSGTPIHSMSPLVKLRWFAAHEPELTRSAATWVGLKDLVIQRLTGQLVTELSSASGTGLLDLSTRTWDPEAVALAGIRLDQLPDVLPTTTALPLWPAAARRVGLPAGTPVVLGAGDGPLGNLGTGAMGAGVAGLSLGTSGALRLMTEQPYVDPEGRLFCYALTEHQWVIGTPISNGGAIVRWAKGVFASAPPRTSPQDLPETTDAAVLALAEVVPPGSEGLVMLPFLLAERGPLWDPDLRGAYLGIRHHHTNGHFVRAAVEGVALQLATILDVLDRLQPVTSIRATGGVFRSTLWRDVVAGVLDRPLSVTGGAGGSALGAAALGLHAVGAAPDPTSALALLAPDLLRPTDPSATVVPSAADVTAYRDLRRSVTGLVDGLAASAALLGAGVGN